MRARRPGDRIDALIDARLAACEARNVPMLWWTGPSTMPANLGERLDRCGFVLEAARGMVDRSGVQLQSFRHAHRGLGALGRSRRRYRDAGALEPRVVRFVRRAAAVRRVIRRAGGDDRARPAARRFATFSRASTVSPLRRVRSFSDSRDQPGRSQRICAHEHAARHQRAIAPARLHRAGDACSTLQRDRNRRPSQLRLRQRRRSDVQRSRWRRLSPIERDRVERSSAFDDHADVVMSNAVLHFARDGQQFEAMLRQMWRVLKPGGIFFARLASTIGIDDPASSRSAAAASGCPMARIDS